MGKRRSNIQMVADGRGNEEVEKRRRPLALLVATQHVFPEEKQKND